jgi:hypothetical protein
MVCHGLNFFIIDPDIALNFATMATLGAFEWQPVFPPRFVHVSSLSITTLLSIVTRLQ